MAVTTTTFTYDDVDIRIAPELSMCIPCLVNNTGVDAGSDGRKILKAGTPIGAGSAIVGTSGSETDVLLKRDVHLQKDTTYPQGILLHDVDVTNASSTATENAVIMIAGYVDYAKLTSAVQTLVTTAFMTETESTTTTNVGNKNTVKIRFINGRA